MLKTTKNQWVLATTAALLIGGCASNSRATSTPSSSLQHDMGQCSGTNSCKGAGSCATANNGCAGQNTCKGKGWIPLTKSDCEARDGRFSGFKK